MKVMVLHPDFKTNFKTLPEVEEWWESDAGHSTQAHKYSASFRVSSLWLVRTDELILNTDTEIGAIQHAHALALWPRVREHFIPTKFSFGLLKLIQQTLRGHWETEGENIGVRVTWSWTTALMVVRTLAHFSIQIRTQLCQNTQLLRDIKNV